MNQSPPLPGPCSPHPHPPRPPYSCNAAPWPGRMSMLLGTLKHASHSGPGVALLGGSHLPLR